MSEYKLQLKGVCKSFPGVKALDNVQLSLRPGYMLSWERMVQESLL